MKHFHKPKEVELPSFFQALNIRMYGCLLKHITGVYWWCEEFWRVQGYAVSSDSARARKNWLYGALACKWIVTQKHFSAIECFLLLNIKRRAEKPQNQARIKGSCSKGLGERKRKCTVWWRYLRYVSNYFWTSENGGLSKNSCKQLTQYFVKTETFVLNHILIGWLETLRLGTAA